MIKEIHDINGKQMRVNHILLDKDSNKWVVFYIDNAGWAYKPLHEIPGEGAYFLIPNEVNNNQLKIIGEITKNRK